MYTISTVTAVCSISADVDLDVVLDRESGLLPGARVADAGGDSATVVSVERGTFGGQVTVIMSRDVDPTRKINMKLFRNGRVQMTGLRHPAHGPGVVGHLVALLRDLRGLARRHELAVSGYQVCLINSDFDLRMRVDRDKLYRVTRAHYDVAVSYEPCIYPGVKLKFMWGEQNSPQGVCACSAASVCKGKGTGCSGDTCRKVTIVVFHTGKVIITGATTTRQIDDAQRLLVDDIVARHSDEFVVAPASSAKEPPVDASSSCGKKAARSGGGYSSAQQARLSSPAAGV